MEEKTKKVSTLFDSGSFYTIVREDVLPETKFIHWYPLTKEFKTAGITGKVEIKGATRLIIEFNHHRIDEDVLISSNINREMIIGAKTMQAWDITITNKNGHTVVTFGKDMRDPEITEVD